VADRFGLTVVAELIEPPSTSGFKNRGLNRPRFKELLGLIRQGEIGAVIVYQTDRLSRGGGVGWAPMLEAIESAGHDPNHFVLRPDGWLSEFEMGIRATIDREEAVKISSRLRDVRAREALEGKPRTAICRGYGYDYDKATKNLVIVEREAEAIREATRRVLAGESPYSVAKDFTRRGVPTVSGCPWTTSVLISILRSARIAGLRSHHGVVVAKGAWEPIITEAEHERLLAVTAPRPGRRKKSAPRTFPLVGFLVCGKCGKPLRSLVGKDRRRYGCRTNDNLGGCGGIQVSANSVENEVKRYVCTTLSHPRTRKRLLAAAPKPAHSADDKLFARIRELDLKRQRLTGLAVDGHLSPAEFVRKNTELDDERDSIEQALAAEPRRRAVAALPATKAELETAWDERGIDYQRLLIELTIDHITVNPASPQGPRFNPHRLDWRLRG
jgi:DNA invertase Pin-like site-specific DNA recombinase